MKCEGRRRRKQAKKERKFQVDLFHHPVDVAVELKQRYSFECCGFKLFILCSCSYTYFFPFVFFIVVVALAEKKEKVEFFSVVMKRN